MDQYFLTLGRYGAFKVIFGLQAKAFQIYKIGYYFNIVFYLFEKFVGIFFQILRYGSNTVRFIDRKSYHRFISTIFTYQRNIGTMQRSYHRDINTVSLQYLLSHKRSRSMG